MAEPGTVENEIKTEEADDQLLKHSLTDPGLISPDRENVQLLAVPFVGRIRGGMRTGKKILIMGIVDPEPDSLDISLVCGRVAAEGPPVDVALELRARFEDRRFTRRARVSGAWGEAEMAIAYFPFIEDQPFRIEIHCEHQRFRIFVDGHPLFDFPHRVASLPDIDTIRIGGSLRLTKLG